MIYCSNRKCPRMDCVRRLQYGPFGEVLRVVRYEPKQETVCDGFLSEVPSSGRGASDIHLVEKSNGQMAFF